MWERDIGMGGTEEELGLKLHREIASQSPILSAANYVKMIKLAIKHEKKGGMFKNAKKNYKTKLKGLERSSFEKPFNSKGVL